MSSDDKPRQFRKLPVVIDAILWTGNNLRDVIAFTGRHPSADAWTWEHFEEIVRTKGLKIFTLEGQHMATVGDYIIKGVHGECYPCKPDIFAKTYEPADASLSSYTLINDPELRWVSSEGVGGRPTAYDCMEDAENQIAADKDFYFERMDVRLKEMPLLTEILAVPELGARDEYRTPPMPKKSRGTFSVWPKNMLTGEPAFRECAPTDGSRLRDKMPLPPEVLVSALQDTIHTDTGRTRRAHAERSATAQRDETNIPGDKAENADLVECLREETFAMRGKRALLFQQASDRITKLERLLARSSTTPRAAERELVNIVNAERFNRERFRDDTEFADWVQSRCRYLLASSAIPPSKGG